MSSAPRPLIIVNPTAARARQAWPRIKTRLAESRVDYLVHETTAAGDATSRTRSALESGCCLIGVVGGDGTLSEAAAGFFSSPGTTDADGPLPRLINPEAALAILPAGTGDDFARNLAGRREPLDRWIESFIAHYLISSDETIRVVDVMRVRTDGYRRERICINASTLGLGGETAGRVAAQGNSMRRLSGEARFVAAAMRALAAWRERPVRVSIDGETVIEAPMNLVAVANARFAGGGMMISPEAKFDDGKLDVVTASGLNRMTILRELGRIHRGGHVANPRVKIFQGSYARIENLAPDDWLPIEVDGNVSGNTPADYLIMRRALRIAAKQCPPQNDEPTSKSHRIR